jgi:S-adenosyl-L-methionine hydrolase (adenosine-forming)
MSPALPARLELGPLSHTFHGRDLFAPLAAALASGALHPGEFGHAARPGDPMPLPPGARCRGVNGRVLLADRFGNLFTNIGAELVAGCRQPVVEAGGREWPLLTSYGAAPPGTPLALINAFGLLELAVNGGSAAALPGLAEGAVVRLRDGWSHEFSASINRSRHGKA